MTKNAVRLSVFCGFLLLTGCDSERIEQFSSLAAAGSAYAATFPVLSEQLGNAQITITNDQAVAAHMAGIDTDTAKAKISQQDTDLKIFLSTIDKLNAQTAVLGAYFAAMAQLANSKNSDQIVTSANGLYTQLKSVNAAVGNSKFSSDPAAKTIDELLGPVTQLVVAHFQVKALDANLNAHAQEVDRALALQEKAVQEMTLILSLAVNGDDKAREQSQVIGPYVSTKDLPKSWASDRTAYIRSSVSLASADAAKDAITKLRTAFQDVVQNKSSQIDFNSLLDVIGKMAGYANDVKTAITTTK